MVYLYLNPIKANNAKKPMPIKISIRFNFEFMLFSRLSMRVFVDLISVSKFCSTESILLSTPAMRSESSFFVESIFISKPLMRSERKS